MTVIADYTPADLDLRLRRRSHTPIPFAFSDDEGPMSLVGYTQMRMLVSTRAAASAIQIAGSVVSGSGGTASVTVDAAAWSALVGVKGGTWQLQALNASGNLVHLVAGRITIEESLA